MLKDTHLLLKVTLSEIPDSVYWSIINQRQNSTINGTSSTKSNFTNSIQLPIREAENASIQCIWMLNGGSFTEELFLIGKCNM